MMAALTKIYFQCLLVRLFTVMKLSCSRSLVSYNDNID